MCANYNLNILLSDLSNHSQHNYSIISLTGADPTFSIEPLSAKVIKDLSFTLSCQISNVGSPLYHWLKDGSNVTRGTSYVGSNSATFTINSVKFSDMGNYSCVATDSQTGRSWTSGSATVIVEGTFMTRACEGNLNSDNLELY